MTRDEAHKFAVANLGLAPDDLDGGTLLPNGWRFRDIDELAVDVVFNGSAYSIEYDYSGAK